MKKRAMVFTVLILVMMVTLIGCTKAKKSPIIGIWDVKTIETSGVTVDFKKFAEQSGVDATFTVEFKEDKTAVMNANGEESAATWEEKDSKYSVTSDGETIDFELKDNILSFSEADMGTLTFEKKAA